MRTLTPDLSYTLDLARAWARGDRQRVAPTPGLDLGRYLRREAARPHLVTLLPHVDLDGTAPEVQALHARLLRDARRRTTTMLLELERLLPALAADGCRPVVLKGASLALTHYEQPTQRWFLDLDLLVDREQLPAVYARLERHGYGSAGGVAPAALYHRHHFHRILRNEHGMCIEVHWAVTLPASVYRFDLVTMRRNALEIPLGDSSFLAPNTIDQILHGVLQSAAGGFGDLRRILDLHRLDAALNPGDHAILAARSRPDRLTTGLWWQYRLREQILSVPVPEEVDAFCRPPGATVRALEGLDLMERCLGGTRHRDGDLPHLVHWLCVPPRFRVREMRRFLVPDGAGLMDFPWAWHGAPLWRRIRLTITRVPTILRLLWWWLLARR